MHKTQVSRLEEKFYFIKKAMISATRKQQLKSLADSVSPQSEWLSSRILMTATTTEKRKQASNVGKNVRRKDPYTLPGRV